MRIAITLLALCSACAGVEEDPFVEASSLATRVGEATHPCATPEPGEADAAREDEELEDDTSAVIDDTPTIDVRILLVRGGNSTDPWFGGIPRSFIDTQMEVLNAAFAPAGFRFELRSFETIVNGQWATNEMKYDRDVVRQREAKGWLEARYPGANVLRIVLLDSGFRLFGWATFPQWERRAPDDDGVVLGWRVLPGHDLDEEFWQTRDVDFTKFGEGHTLVHEVGHWLGLRHTFAGGCLFGDGVGDTPAQARPNDHCSYPEDTCPSIFGPKRPDPTDNYMNYVPDACMTEFTPGQIERMHKMWNKYRAR